MWATNGTPTDCVKLAMHALVDRCPDMVISGINHGSNAAINVLYSGTMGAAMEGCAFGIPSIGFSLTSHDKKADFGGCRPFIRKIVSAVMQNGLPDEVCLNVNIPYQEQSPRRLRLVRQCKGNWRDEYKEYTDPTGKPFFMMSGYFENEEPEATDTDEWCLANNIVSVVPVLLDRTAPLPPPLQQGGQPEAGEEPSQSGSLTARRLQFLRSLEPLDIM
jgi:5'-nucleotidase